METTKGRIRAISISKEKGTPKVNVPQAYLEADFGIVTDAHAGTDIRQVSLLAAESIDRMVAEGLKVSPGDFAENITTEGINLPALKVGSKLIIGPAPIDRSVSSESESRTGADNWCGVELEVTQLGKQCHRRCRVFEKVGDCIMPREGVFAKVTRPGRIMVGDVIEVFND